MRFEDIKFLSSIQHIRNLVSILEKGILSHTSAEGISHESIASEKIQEKRIGKKILIDGGKEVSVHDYANLYLNPRNSMMFTITNAGNDTKNLCVLKVSKNVLNLPNIICSDQNIASTYSRLSTSVDVVGKSTFLKDWRDPHEPTKWRQGSATCAEVLVPKKVEPKYIEGVFCSSKKNFSEKVTSHLNEKNIPIIEDPYLFFASSKESNTLEWF